MAMIYNELMERTNSNFDDDPVDGIGHIIDDRHGEVRDKKLEEDGWSRRERGIWQKEFMAADSLPMPDIEGVRRRVVRDRVNGVIVDDVEINGRTKPSRLARALKKKRDVLVEIEVNEVEGVATVPWEDREMQPSEATDYRGIVARCNFLSIDRPDIMFASKECSRCMARPLNKDWEALKRLGRYLLSRPRVVHLFNGRTSRRSCQPSVTRIGPDAIGRGNPPRERASCSGRTW